MRGAARHRLGFNPPDMPITILIADDNALIRAALRQVLENEKLGEIIVEAENGREAVAKARELKPDLVILDLAMPLMDGFATAREIGTLLPGTPTLMHTLYWSPRVEVEALKAGVRKTVPKSDSNVLIAAVRELLSQIAESVGPVKPDRLDSRIAELPAVAAAETLSADAGETAKGAADEGPPEVQSRAS